MRLTSAFWVSAYIRRCTVEGAYAVLRKRGAAEAGAVFVKIDHLNGEASLFGPAPQSLYGNDDHDRRFARLHEAATISPLDAEERMRKEMRFDPDLWLVEVEDRQGRHFLTL